LCLEAAEIISNQMKEDYMDRTCSMHGQYENYIENFDWKACKEERQLGILNHGWTLKEQCAPAFISLSLSLPPSPFSS
jgi:hypothetical protein